MFQSSTEGKNSIQTMPTVATESKQTTEEEHVSIVLMRCHQSVKKTLKSSLIQNSYFNIMFLAKISEAA